VFLKHPDMVRLVGELAEHPDLASTLRSCEVADDRWPSFVSALQSLESSEVVRERSATG
jgi:mycofactocin biosynthesis protein MftB